LRNCKGKICRKEERRRNERERNIIGILYKIWEEEVGWLSDDEWQHKMIKYTREVRSRQVFSTLTS
jgi:hypothetical protein